MKLVSYEHAGAAGYGIVEGDGIISLSARFGARAPTLRRLIAANALAEAKAMSLGATPDVALAAVRLLPVIPDPDKIICVGLNYHDHIEETGRAQTEKPVLFARFAGSQVGHQEPLIRPAVSTEFDYEGELAVIIGAGGRHIAAADTLAHVAGYACYNDASVRDWQRHTSQFLPGKNFAGTGAFGPWMVTADEVPDPTVLKLRTRLNGQVMQQTEISLMITGIPALIAYISTMLPLLAGDVIVTGTPGGVGSRRTPPLWLQPGDVVEVEISQIGCLRNPVMAEP